MDSMVDVETSLTFLKDHAVVILITILAIVIGYLLYYVKTANIFNKIERLQEENFNNQSALIIAGKKIEKLIQKNSELREEIIDNLPMRRRVPKRHIPLPTEIPEPMTSDDEEL